MKLMESERKGVGERSGQYQRRIDLIIMLQISVQLSKYYKFESAQSNKHLDYIIIELHTNKSWTK